MNDPEEKEEDILTSDDGEEYKTKTQIITYDIHTDEQIVIEGV